MSIPKLENNAHFDPAFNTADLLVVYFTAKWCGPCQQIAPIIDNLATGFPNVTFLKVDIDEHKQLASRFSISSIPTFVFVKRGEELERVRGADVAKVAEEVSKLNGSNREAKRFNIGGSADAEENLSGKEPGIVKYIPQGFSLLNSGIFYSEVEYMNIEDKDGDLTKGVLGKKDVEVDHIHSDIDSQLLVHIPLINVAKVYSILIKSKDVEGFQKPNVFKVWINNSNIVSFDDAGSLNSLNDSEEIGEWDEDGWAEIKLKYVRFQKVKSLDFFFDGDDEDTQTLIEKIVIVGIDGDAVKQGTISKE